MAIRLPKKVAVIGIDCAVMPRFDKYVAEGHLPNIARIIKKGSYAENCLVPYPAVTPPNWASIATGCWPGTHQVTEFSVHEPDGPLDEVVQAFSSKRWQAEPVWETADRAGKKCIVLNYPGGDSKLKNGIVLGKGGLTVGEFRDGKKGPGTVFEALLCWDQLVTTGIYPNAIRGKFEPAKGWSNIPQMGEEPLEMSFKLAFPNTAEKPADTVWHILVRETGKEGYDTVTLSPGKDFKDAFCTLKIGKWSDNIYTSIKIVDGSSKDVFFKVKAIELSEDAQDFRLLITQLCQRDGWSWPPEVARQIVSKDGDFSSVAGMVGATLGWYDLDTYVERVRQNDAWLEDAAVTLLTKYPWDIFFMHIHPPDWVNHMIVPDLDPETCPDENKRKKAWEVDLKILQSTDSIVGKIAAVLDEETLMILVSDHGAVSGGQRFDPQGMLEKAGLLTVKESAEAQPDWVTEKSHGKVHQWFGKAKRVPDLKKSKAIPISSIYVFINLKGRDADGVVEPSDYAKVQHEIIDAFIKYIDPKTGRRPVSLALTKEDARILGLWGKDVGDVVYSIYPEFGTQHAPHLPTQDDKTGSIRGLMVMSGPNIKKGFRLNRTIRLPDLVPTICYLMGLPVPDKTEGAIIYQAFENPNVQGEEMTSLKEKLAKMEASLSGSKES